RSSSRTSYGSATTKRRSNWPPSAATSNAVCCHTPSRCTLNDASSSTADELSSSERGLDSRASGVHCRRMKIRVGVIVACAMPFGLLAACDSVGTTPTPAPPPAPGGVTSTGTDTTTSAAATPSAGTGGEVAPVAYPTDSYGYAQAALT